jgi:long-chain acyl-CoA synthetase
MTGKPGHGHLAFNSLAAMFAAQAARYGDKVLYRYFHGGRWRALTWNEAFAQTREIVLGLVSLGLARGDRVAIFSNNRLEWLLADWANISIGALTVPIYASSSTSQAAHIIGHADPAVLLVDSSKRLDRLDFSRTPLSQLKTIVVFDHETVTAQRRLQAGVMNFEGLKQLGRDYGERHPGAFDLLFQSLRPDDDLTIIYTSGTTGTPKGVLTTHAHYLFMIQAVDAAVPSTDRDVTLHFLPTAHSLGRLEHFMAVAKGWTLGIARSIETLTTDLKVIRPTVIFSVPRIYENAFNRIRLRMSRAGGWRKRLFDWSVVEGRERVRLLKLGEKPSWRRSLAFALIDGLLLSRLRAGFGGRLRLAIAGGAPLSAEIAEFFYAIGIVVLEGYGLTETSTVSHVNRPGRIQLGTVGLPLDGTTCRIDEDGEILLRGPHIFKCYYRDLMATEEAIDADGWFHSGDIGEVDGEGFLRVTERKRDLIVTSGGKKVAPQKLEKLLTADPLIHQSLIVGRGQRHLMALITVNRTRALELARAEGIDLGSGESLTSHPWLRQRVRKIIESVNRELAAYETVRNFCILDHDFTVASEELTPTLKPRRQVIVERYKELIEDMYRKAS